MKKILFFGPLFMVLFSNKTLAQELGKDIYIRTCQKCHGVDGREDRPTMPRLAGQHQSVLKYQLSDIRRFNRDVPKMYPYSIPSRIGGKKAVDAVTKYLSEIKQRWPSEYGTGTNMEVGERVYIEHCASCHGVSGEGDSSLKFPRLKGQHYSYLLRQQEWMLKGYRRKVNPVMLETLKELKAEDLEAISDFISRMQ